MKYTTTVRKLLNCKAGLQELANTDMDVVPAFRIGVLIEQFNDIAEAFEKSRKKLVKTQIKSAPQKAPLPEQVASGTEEKVVYNEGFSEETFQTDLDAILDADITVEFRAIDRFQLTVRGELIVLKPSAISGLTWVFKPEPEED